MTTPDPTFRYKAFISYSWKDKAAAEALHRALETYRPPTLPRGAPAPLKPIFRDRDEEAAGASLKSAIEDALDNSEFLIVVCSPNSAGSKWVNKEIAYFRKRRTPANVLCYVVSGDPAVDALPPAILRETTVDGDFLEEPIEAPLAADARKEGDGPRIARLKIAAALMGSGLDDLVRRDAARRVQRLRTALAGASALVVAFAGVAAYAVIQRNVAVENEKLAKREALKASRTAEFMVRLFEVPDPSESRGKQVTAREILDKGVASIERDLKDEPDVQASLMYTMGRSYTGLGLYPDAARILSVARDKRVETKADPADLFATEQALARAEFEKGDLDKAHELYSKLVKEAEDEIAKGGWRVEYATALIGLGETTLYRDTAEEAQKYYERARDLLEAHGMGESEEMARALQGLAAALTDQDEFSDAEANLLRARSLVLSKQNTNIFKMTDIDNDLGYVYYMDRQLEKAIAATRRSLLATKSVLGERHPETLATENNLARYEFEAGNVSGAGSKFEEILREFDEIGRGRHYLKAFPLNSLAEIELERGNTAVALQLLEDARTLATADSARLRATILMNTGRAQCELGEVAIGAEKIDRARDQLSEFYERNNWRYGVADEFQSRCEAKVGKNAEAEELARQASAILDRELGDKHYFTRRAIAWRDRLQTASDTKRR